MITARESERPNDQRGMVLKRETPRQNVAALCPSTFSAFACLYFCFMSMLRSFFRLRVDEGAAGVGLVIICKSRHQWVIDQRVLCAATPRVKSVRYRVYRVAH